MQAVFETLFDIVYLITVITLGICMIRGNRGRRQYLLYGVMAVTLGCGDAFHLVPRGRAVYDRTCRLHRRARGASGAAFRLSSSVR